MKCETSSQQKSYEYSCISTLWREKQGPNQTTSNLSDKQLVKLSNRLFSLLSAPPENFVLFLDTGAILTCEI